MNPNDVTVEMALSAFEKTGLAPKSGIIYDRSHALGACGCLLGALYLSDHPDEKGMDLSTEYVVGKLFNGDYGGYLLASGFDSGFDNLPARLMACPPFAIGYHVGEIMRARLESGRR